MKQIIWIALSWFALMVPAQAASFSCAKANTNIEKMICADPELSELDSDLNELYQQTLEQSTDRLKAVSEQRQWLRTERNPCQDVVCLKKIYQTRFDEFAKTQTQAGNSEPNSSQYIVRCDKENQMLIVSDSASMPVIEPRHSDSPVSEYRIYPDSLTKIRGSDMDARILPSGRKLYRCQLGKALYKVTIEPHIENSNPNGECGAAGADISLSIRRNGERILSNIEFEHCRYGSQTGQTIKRIQFSEVASSIKILSIPNNIFLPIDVEKTFSLTTPPNDWPKAIFEDYPTGDVNADLFIAVYKRDVTAIKQALQRGASPNTKDIEGFPPLALLGTGREDAYGKMKIVEFDRQSEEMAKVLFAGGATANAKNINGVPLLWYLLASHMPNSVIDMMLSHGGDIEDGAPLVQAAFLGNEYLVNKFLGLGADPNRVSVDGNTAIRAAATSGLYGWNAWNPPPVSEYAKCIRLLIIKGADVHSAVKSGTINSLVSQFGKDERLKVILAELIPHMTRNEIEDAQKLAGNYSKSLAKWLSEQTY